MEECKSDYAYECENSTEKIEEVDDDLDLIDKKVQAFDINEYDKKNGDEEYLSDNIQVVSIFRTHKGIILSDYLTRSEYKDKYINKKELQLLSSSYSDNCSYYKNKVVKIGEINSDKYDCILDSDKQVKKVHTLEDENTRLWIGSKPNDTQENIETKPTDESELTN